MVLEQQQEVQEKEFALCLNMIVKNESHIIKDKLTKLLKKIKFDYWVISDTGSTDETMEIIADFFKEVRIPGELYEDEWVDFSHNRNRALGYAFRKSKYLLVFDADDEICGNFVLPDLTRDSYSLQFGSYTRPQIVNNHKRWKYVGVLHEYICSADSRIDDANTEIIKGPYHVISGRTGNRSLDSNKYLKDAIILEKAYNDAVIAKDNMHIRYGFYCANSYYDCGKYESAISWYKKTLENGGWAQEKYVSCLKLYNCYNNLDNKEAGFFYLVKSAEYDRERAECYYELIKYYSGSGLHDVAYGYYGVLRDFYHDTYLNDDLNNKLFVDVSISEFHLPYYVIIVCEKMRNYETGIHMYRIIFTKKCKIFDTWSVSNMLYNLQFFTEHVKEEDKTAFYSLFKEYVDFLVANNYPISDDKHKFMKTYEKYGIKKREASITDECLSSKKILIYTGFMDYLWNDTYISNNAAGGAEKAVAYLARNFPKEYEIIISGDVTDEVVGNVRYVNRFKLQALLDFEKFHTIIVSRYVSFFILFPQFNCHQLYLSAHDTGFLNNFNDVPVNSIIEENNKYINGVICLTTWHKLNVIQSHPCLKDKVSIINNGILVPVVASSDGAANANASLSHNISHNNKIKNKFVWTSCSSRGLDLLLKLWDKILEVMPDATLDISSYDAFPNPNRNKDEEIEKLITQYSDSVTHHGKLNTLQLHDLISKAEYWLYTCTFYETSCITALEMLMHEVVCFYYPLAGLNETIGKYGIQVIPGTEVQSIVNLSEERKAEMRINGKKYATSCSWENRAKEWASVLGLLTKTPFCDNGPDGDYYFKNNRTIIKKEWVFFCSIFFEKKMIQHYIDNLNILYADADYYIHLTSDKEAIMKSKPEKVTIVYEVFDSSIFNALPNSKFSFLNTEPLTIPYRLDNIKLIFELYKKHMDSFNYYDYSESNLRLLNDKCIGVGVDNVYLPYKCSSEELSMLQNLNKNANKEYDFGILKTLGKEVSPRRKKIVDFLKYHNFSVNIIEGWNYNDRDFELAKCKIILNIHGNLNNDVSTIFEHIRCDRLLEAGFNILSETSCDLCPEFVQKYPNLRLIKYEDFFDIGIMVDCYNNPLMSKEHNKYVLDILNNCYNKIDIPLVHISFIEKLSLEFNPNRMVIYDIGSSVLHWSQHAKVFWKNSTVYLFDAMTEMKLFYDEYNKIKNTTFEYNVGVLCDEDYKRISFYQNDELSGGNSYYKEIGHPESHNIFTENHIKHKLGMKLETVVKNKKIPLPDLIKIDVQGAELDILKGSMNIINNAKFLIVELQHVEYNKGAPLCNKTCDFLIENGWEVYAEKFSNNGPDADWCFINKNKKNNKTIVDCFTFYNELDMLTYRLNILDKVVDYFVLVESTHTHVGKEKPLFYNENKHLFKKFNHKIIHIVVDDFPHKYPNINIEKQEQWINERFQRDCISRGIDKLNLTGEDIITITDLDEIPNPNILTQIKNNIIIVGINIIELDLYYYNLNSKMDHKWYHSKILTFEKYKELNTGCDNIRFLYCPIINNAGWHLSYFGNEKFIKNKLENFTHQEFNMTEFTDEKRIEERIKNGKDLFDRPNSIIHINIEDNNNLPPDYDIYLKNYYDSKQLLRKDIDAEMKINSNKKERTDVLGLNNDNTMNVGFFVRHFTERGTEVAIYDYAKYNEEILNNKSYIICFTDLSQKNIGFSSERKSYSKFNSRFPIIEINNIEEMTKIINEYKLSFFYVLTYGGSGDIYQFNNKNIWGSCKTIKHCVFDTTFPESDFYISISTHLNKKYNTNLNVIPHIVNLPNCLENLRDELNIPHNVTVLGRYGGMNEFDIKIAHEAIIEYVNNNENVYFLFMNTAIFFNHPRIIYLEGTVDTLYKVKFINTCDAMIHAREIGETFGLSIGEFSIKNKPIITCSCGDLEHVRILRDKAILYTSKEELMDIFKNIKQIINSRTEWNAYEYFSPENIMILFQNIFEHDLYDNFNLLNTKVVDFHGFKFEYFENDDMARGSIEKNIQWENHITKFVNLYNRKYSIKNIIDVGANFGYHSIFFSKEVDGCVFSFEPQIQNYKLLKNNVKNNNIKNIKLYNLACGDVNCDVRMPVITENKSGVNMGDFTPNQTSISNKYTTTKSILLDDMKFPKIDLIKIDVQGWEKKVLLGSINLLKKHKPILIIEFEYFQLEKTNTTCEELYHFIRSNNYYIFYLEFDYPSDHICVHNDNLESFKSKFKDYIFEHDVDNNLNHNIKCGVVEKIVMSVDITSINNS